MECALEFVSYRRPFAVPLRTAKGHWFEREGIVVRLQAEDGRVGFGEVAPIPRFGSETVEAAERFLGTLGSRIRRAQLAEVPDELRCCRFALGSAWSTIDHPEVPYVFQNTALLPTGESAIDALIDYLRVGFRCFKLKIGVASTRVEVANVQGILSLMPSDSRLRLDANGALDVIRLELWLDALEGYRGVDFVEQPMKPGSETKMRGRADSRKIDVALDESLVTVDGVRSTLDRLCWRGPLVLKSALLGLPDELLQAIETARNRLVFSSVFETGIGLHNGLRLAAQAGACEAVGYGTLAYFADDLNIFRSGPMLTSDTISTDRLEQLWKVICGEFARA